jgi:FixJ family two-component response regulator
MTGPSPVIHVVDDDESFRSAAARMLRAAGYAVECYASAGEFLARSSGGPGCILADLQMPGMTGLELQTTITSSQDPLPIVFLSGHGDVHTSVQAMKHGAEDFLTKTASAHELLDAIQRALARDLDERARRRRQSEVDHRVSALTPREREVLALVVRGKLNKEIAFELGIHERTVKLHRTAITGKLGIHSVAELTLFAREARLLP